MQVQVHGSIGDAQQGGEVLAVGEGEVKIWSGTPAPQVALPLSGHIVQGDGQGRCMWAGQGPIREIAGLSDLDARFAGIGLERTCWA
jgi:hypothetical protein